MVGQARKTNTIDSRRNLSICYCDFGEFYTMLNKNKLAEKFYKKVLALCEDLAKEMATIVARRDLSVSYERLCSFYKEQGDPNKTEYFYTKDFTLCKKIQEEINSI